MESKTENHHRPNVVERQVLPTEPATATSDAEQEYLATMLRLEMEEEGHAALADWGREGDNECVMD